MLRRTLVARRLARYEREHQKSVDKEEGLKPLRLARRAPRPGDALRLLWPYAQNVPLYEALTVPSIREMLVDPATASSVPVRSGSSGRPTSDDSGFFDGTFSETPPMPCLLPPHAMAATGGAVHKAALRNRLPEEAPRSSLLLDAIIIVKGLEKTDLRIAATPLLDQLQPALRQHSAVEHDCLRFNLPPALSAPSSRVPAQKPLVPTTKSASFFRTIDDTYGDEAVRTSRARNVPLESVEYFVGFADTMLSLGALHRVRNDRDRRLARVSFGCSHALQQRLLHPQVWRLARFLDAFWNSKRGGMAAALGGTGQPLPFAFTVSVVSWAVAAGALADTLPSWLAAADANLGDGQLNALLAVAADVVSFLEHGAWSGGRAPPSRNADADAADADTDSMTSAELLATLRARSFGGKRRKGTECDSAAPVPAPGHAAKPHFVWRNFFLPCEHLDTMPPVAAVQQELAHRGATSPREPLPRPSHGDALSAFAAAAPGSCPTEDLGRDVPDLYYRKVFTR